MLIMNRKETTEFLGRLLKKERFGGIGKYWASEVSIDPWSTKGKGKRVDYMQFIPDNQCAISALEKGIFVCYEVKLYITEHEVEGGEKSGKQYFIPENEKGC